MSVLQLVHHNRVFIELTRDGAGVLVQCTPHSRNQFGWEDGDVSVVPSGNQVLDALLNDALTLNLNLRYELVQIAIDTLADDLLEVTTPLSEVLRTTRTNQCVSEFMHEEAEEWLADGALDLSKLSGANNK